MKCAPSVSCHDSDVTDLSIARNDKGIIEGFWVYTKSSSTYLSRELIEECLKKIEEFV